MQQHEKTSLRYVFFRLYSNDELLDFLKEQLKNGLVLDHCKGNFFFFRRWQLQNARLCVISIPCSKPRVEDDDEVQEYLDIRTLYRSVTKKTPLPEDLGLRLRRCESLRLWSMGAVLAGMVLLLLS